MTSKILWTFADAINFITELSNALVPANYEVALAGSVLKRGSSQKDLDIILFPRSITHAASPTTYRNLQEARAIMRADLGMTCVLDEVQVKKEWKAKGSSDQKHVEVWRYRDKRIDIFFLS